jgi:hypothetical protein
MIPDGIAGVSVLAKTRVTFGLVLLTLFEFFTAMYVYGARGKKRFGKTVLTLHRVGGYIFLFYWVWPILVGADLLTRLSRYQDGWSFDGPRFYHAFLGVAVLLLLLLKILFVRFYPQFRTSARWLGIVITIGALTTWVISGWFWLCMMGGAEVGG